MTLRSSWIAVGAALVVGLGGCSEVSPDGSSLDSVLGALKAGAVPGKFTALLTSASGKYCTEVTGPVLATQIEHESGWNPAAVSPVGARGIAQFMPETWSTWGKDANGNGTASPLEPADAIDAQARFMCKLVQIVRPLATSSGKPVLDLAWAAYNAGPGAVQKYGGIPPYAETQSYVKKLRASLAKFADGDGAVSKSGSWSAPMKKGTYTLTSGFGPRSAPCNGCSSNHQGLDFAGPIGTPLLSVCNGRVIHAGGNTGGFGTAVGIDCGNGIRVINGHMSSVSVAVGSAVRSGQKIGGLGNTGNSTGPHLHLEIHTGAPAGSTMYAGTPVDPAGYLGKRGVSL